MQVRASFTGHSGPVYALAEGPAPGTFLSASGDGLVVLWHIDRPDKGVPVANAGQAVFSMALSHNGGLLFIGTEGGAMHVVDLHANQELRRFEVHRRGIFRIVEIPGGRLACAGGDGCLSIWAPRQGHDMTFIRSIPLVEEKLRDLLPLPGLGILAVACGDGSVRLLDTAHFNELHTIAAHTSDTAPGTDSAATGTIALAVHPRKPILVSGGKDGHLRTWRTDQSFVPLLSLPAHKGGIYRISFSPDERLMATASRDKTTKLWDARSMEPLARLDRPAGGHTHSVNTLLWCGGMLLTAGDDRHILAWGT